ncbi:MAG: endonuclease III [Bacteroidales bacterium]|nr:endonuclease III [Bacteroidales bacterium]
MSKKERYRLFIEYFSKHQPEASTELTYTDPYELLVAVILSAQCTDKRVNMITPGFFMKFPDAPSLSKATIKEVYELIKSCSYPNNKTKHLVGMAKTLVNDFDNVVPSEVDQLQKLPGVGRKTANVIASVVYKKPAMAVDTHVFRVAERIGLTTNAKNPREAEEQLVKHLPEDKIHVAHHWLILHGRYICQARRPKCEECGLTDFCKYYQKTIKPSQ